jgi:hypothetical protein
MVMKEISGKIAGIAVLAAMLALFASGCTAQKSSTPSQFNENFRFVPRVHVEDNSFGVTGGGEYRGCSYDTLYEGYWCPIR